MGVKLTTNAGSGAIVPTTVLNIGITVSGGKNAKTAPTGLWAVVDDTSLVDLGFLPASTSGSATTTVSLLAGDLLAGVNNLLVVYLGDSNYLPAYAPISKYTENYVDFTLAATTQDITVNGQGSMQTDQGLGFVQLQSVAPAGGIVNLSCKVTGGPAGNTVFPMCIVPAETVVSSKQPTTAIVRIDASPVASRDPTSESIPVPPGTYAAVVTGTTATATHDVAVTITVK